MDTASASSQENVIDVRCNDVFHRPNAGICHLKMLVVVLLRLVLLVVVTTGVSAVRVRKMWYDLLGEHLASSVSVTVGLKLRE